MNRPLLVTAQFLVLMIVYATPSRAALLDRVGVMGDSLSSEFVGGLGYINNIPLFGGTFAPYQNWVEILATRRGINFGPYGYWGFNRREGYQFNQASVFNVDSFQLLSQGQHNSLRSLNPTLAVLMIGGNDFFFHLQNHGVPVFGGDGQDPQVIVASMLSRIQTVVNTVAGPISSPTGTEMILATVPDLTRVPAATLFESLAFPGSIGRYRSAIESFNSGLRSLAASRGFAVLDLYEGLNDILGPLGSPSTVTLAGVEFNEAFSQLQRPTDLFLGDGFHPNTAVHAIIAREMISVLNDDFGTSLAPINNAEFRSIVGVVPEVSAPILLSMTVLSAVTIGCLCRRRSTKSA